MNKFQARYNEIKSNNYLSNNSKKTNYKLMEKPFGMFSNINTTPPDSNRGDYDYDRYGTGGKRNRLSSRGSYSEVKLLKTERPLGDPNKFAKAICNNDTIIIGDLKLNAFIPRTEAIIKAVNSRTPTDGKILFIGNLLDEGNLKAWNLIMDFVNRIYANNLYLILGDNDIFSVDDYINFGFSYVTDRAEKTVSGIKLIYTYYPVPVMTGQLNIHGHPHDGLYKLISPDRHFDARITVNNNGTRIYTLDEIIKEG